MGAESEQHPRAGITDQAVERYADKAGADANATAWAMLQARNALENGVQEGEAILHAMNEVDLYMQFVQQPTPQLDRFVRDAGMEA